MPTKEIIALWASYSTTEPVFYAISLPALWEESGRDFKSEYQRASNPGVKLALLHNLKFTKVCINLEKYVIR
jgi:hypothetical protein